MAIVSQQCRTLFLLFVGLEELPHPEEVSPGESSEIRVVPLMYRASASTTPSPHIAASSFREMYSPIRQ